MEAASSSSAGRGYRDVRCCTAGVPNHLLVPTPLVLLEAICVAAVWFSENWNRKGHCNASATDGPAVQLQGALSTLVQESCLDDVWGVPGRINGFHCSPVGESYSYDHPQRAKWSDGRKEICTHHLQRLCSLATLFRFSVFSLNLEMTSDVRWSWLTAISPWKSGTRKTLSWAKAFCSVL